MQDQGAQQLTQILLFVHTYVLATQALRVTQVTYISVLK